MSEKRKIVVDGQEFEVEIELIDGKWEVSLGGKTFIVETDSAKRHVRRAKESESSSMLGASGTISSAIPGKVVSILVSKGDLISAGDVVLVLEAMKMENNVMAEKSGVVKEVLVSKGDSVGAGDVLAVIE